MNCQNCGERLEGDGYKQVLHCPNAIDEGAADAIDQAEPDANPIHCTTTLS